MIDLHCGADGRDDRGDGLELTSVFVTDLHCGALGAEGKNEFGLP